MATSRALRLWTQQLHVRAVTARRFHRTARALLPEVAFKLADIGEGIAEVEVLQWFVHEGDVVHQFEHVCEVQSDKATVEITSRYDGTVKKLHYAVGTKAKVGSTLLDIEVDDKMAVDDKSTFIAEPTIPPVVAATIPTSIEIENTPIRGPGSIYPSTDHLRINAHSSKTKVLTSPAVRRLARDHNLDLADVFPTGPGGRVLKEDVLNHIHRLAEASADDHGAKVEASAPAETEPTPREAVVKTSPAYLTEDTVVQLTPTRRMMVQTMTAALQVPHFNYGDEVEMDALYELKETLKPIAAAQGIKLTYMPFFIKAASLALQSYPTLNASVRADLTSLKMHAAHNISVAVDTPEGLVVPNIKWVQNKTILQIACELRQLQERAKEGTLTPTELNGGTFSLSNIGTLGGVFLSPVVLVPQVAIGAMGKVRTLPRFAADGSVKPVRLMSVGWSGDHRVIEGAMMARFSNKWKEYLETPVTMLAEMH